MWPFSRKQKPIWKLKSRELIRHEVKYDDDPHMVFPDCFDVFAVTYVNVLDKNETKIEEIWELK